MPVTKVLVAFLVGLLVCSTAGVVLSTTAEPAIALIGSILLGLAAFFGTALLLDRR